MEFLKGPSKTGNDQVKAYILYGGWSGATIKHYNAGVSKLITFANIFKLPRSALLPIEPEVLYQFVIWAGPKIPGEEESQASSPIKSTTIRTYLSGIKAWHLYHDCEYPHHATPRIELLLTTAKKLDLKERVKTPKETVLVKHLFALLENLTDKSLEDMVAYTVALVAFWGMARLGELLKHPNAVDQVRVKDLVWGPEGEFLTIKIRAAKTAAVGEVQELHLQKQDTLLDPVSAVRRLIDYTRPTDDKALFSYPVNDRRKILTKSRGQAIFAKVWSRSPDAKLTGHSFRVGGASLRWNLGVKLEIIVRIGRWKSKAYQLYLREYSEEVLRQTQALLTSLRLPNTTRRGGCDRTIGKNEEEIGVRVSKGYTIRPQFM